MILWPSFWIVLFGSVLVFWLLPERFRMGFVAAVSWAYLMYLQPANILMFTAWTLAVYQLAPYATRTGWRAWIVTALNLGLLGQLLFWKYGPDDTDMMGHESWALPIGLSYFTFKLIHFCIEAGRKNVKDLTFSTYLAWVFLLPIFTAGPIERHDRFLVSRSSVLQRADVVFGLTRIVHGLVKRFVIIDAMFTLLPNPGGVAHVLAHLDRIRVPSTWYVLGLWFLSGYLDFSAYSDIAIGAARLYGIRIAENFDWPILATNIGDYWKRWHRSLAAFCQAYVYLPMIGLTRRPLLASYLTFIVMGLWHDASLNWVGWGLWHATGVYGYIRILAATRGVHARWVPWKPLGVMATWAWVLIGLAIVAPPNLYQSLRLVGKLFGIRIG